MGAITVTGRRRAVAAVDVDVGGRDLHRSDRAQARSGRDDVAVDLVVQQAEQDVELRHPREQLVLGDLVQGVGVQLDVGDRAQALDRARGDGLGDVDLRAHALFMREW